MGPVRGTHVLKPRNHGGILRLFTFSGLCYKRWRKLWFFVRLTALFLFLKKVRDTETFFRKSFLTFLRRVNKLNHIFQVDLYPVSLRDVFLNVFTTFCMFRKNDVNVETRVDVMFCSGLMIL